MKGVEFIFENQLKNQQVEISTDPNRLKQILFNLLGNALKFTKKGFIKLNIIQEFHDEENYIKIAIEDSGIGIKKENMKKLFKMFGKLEQQDSSINKQGVGLGLSICDSVSKMLNPNSAINGIHVDSEEGKGSIFSFLIPMKKENVQLIGSSDQIKISSINSIPIKKNDNEIEAIKISENTKDKQKSKKQMSELKCMAIDDDQTSLYAITSFLKLMKINFVQGSSGEEAIENIQKMISSGDNEMYDFILMDNEMPGLNGLETAAKIKHLLVEKNKHCIPIIILSGDAIDIIESVGIVSTLQKPISKIMLSTTIGNIMNVPF